MYASIPESGKVDKNIVDSINTAKEIIAGIRTIRLQKNIPNKETLKLQVIGKFNNENSSIIKKLANLSDIEEVGEKDPTASTFLVGTTEYSVPLGNNINIEEELNKLETELTYLKGFLKSIDAKLSNEKFVNNAPAQVVDGERKKKSDAESKIKTIEESISKLKSC